MPSEDLEGHMGSAPTKAGLITNPDALAKTSALFLGSLYALGLLITNLQMLHLGISDFAALRVRYIFVGFLFLIYVLILLLPLVPVLTLSAVPSRITIRFAYVAISSAVLVLASGGMIGTFYPWGHKLAPLRQAFSLPEYESFFRDALSQFAQAYVHPMMLRALIMVAFAVQFIVWTRSAGRPKFDGIISRSPDSSVRYTRLGMTSSFVGAFAFLVYGYATEVYPNLRYNLGGGQPQVVELAVDAVNSGVARALGIPVSAVDSSGARVGPLVLWHRSADFFYVVSLNANSSDPVYLVALASDSVRGVRVLPLAVKVESGGRISEVLRDSGEPYRPSEVPERSP